MVSITKVNNASVIKQPDASLVAILNNPVDMEIRGSSIEINTINRKRYIFQLSEITLASNTNLATASIDTIITELIAVLPMSNAIGL